jgi:hypothetical protein
MVRANSNQGLQTFFLENFGGGLDLRAGKFSLAADRFADFQNVTVTKGKLWKRRAPLRRAPGAFGINATYGSFGLVEVNGLLYTLSARGFVPGIPSFVAGILYIDIPVGGVAGASRLLEIRILGGHVCALFAHTLEGAERCVLHVLDGAPDLPTYVSDPGFPWAMQIGGIGRVCMETMTSKVWMGTPTFDVANSATSLPRVWNTRTHDDLLAFGYEFRFFAVNAGASDYVAPVNYADVIDMARFASYVVEQYIGTDGDYEKASNWGSVAGSGIPMTQKPGSPGADEFSIINSPNTSVGASYPYWTGLRFNPSTAGRWFRIRIQPPNVAPTPVPISIRTGCVVRDDYGTNELPPVAFTGNGTRTAFTLPIATYWFRTGGTYAVIVGGALKTLGADYSVAAGTNGEPVITLTAAPGAGVAITIEQLTKTDYAVQQLHVPAGTISTPAGIKTWNGGVVPAGQILDGTPCMVGIALDVNYNPIGAFAVACNSNGSSAANTAMVNGAVRAYTCWIGSRWYATAGVLDYVWRQGYQLSSRSPAWDETEFEKSGLAAGDGDAGSIKTGNHTSSGGPVTMLQGVKNRLLVSYRSGSELWAVDTLPSSCILLDVSELGTGDQTQPHASPFAGEVIMPSVQGIRSVNLRSQLSDVLKDDGIGNEIAAFGSPNQYDSVAWAAQSRYMAAVQLNGQMQFLVYDYSREEKITAWSRWNVAGVTSVDYRTMIAIGQRLYFRSGAALFYFDETATDFIDDTDDPGFPFLTMAVSNFNSLRRPNVTKRFSRLSVVATGTATYTFRTLAWRPSFEELGITLTDGTFGLVDVPLMFDTAAVSYVVRSRDRTGFQMEAIGLRFCLLNESIL